MRLQRYFGQSQNISPPVSPASAFSPAGFLACPVPSGPYAGVHLGWAQIYRIAYEQAHAGLQPSWSQRLLLPSLN